MANKYSKKSRNPNKEYHFPWLKLLSSEVLDTCRSMTVSASTCVSRLVLGTLTMDYSEMVLVYPKRGKLIISSSV